MGLLSHLLFWPVSGPVAGVRWTLGKIQHVVEEQLTDDTAVREELMELHMRHELGDLGDQEYKAEEGRLMARLREVREWRERLGKATTGGPVRVARDDDETG